MFPEKELRERDRDRASAGTRSTGGSRSSSRERRGSEEEQPYYQQTIHGIFPLFFNNKNKNSDFL